MIYGYARVSTSGQAKNGNSLEAQEEELRQYGCGEIVKEAYTGTKVERPRFEELLERMQPGDTLMVTKLDRFARTAVDGVQKVESLLQRGIKVHVLNMGLIEDTPIGRLILTTMLAFAQFERDMIVERTQTGKEIARKRSGYKEGRPKIEPENLEKYQKAVSSGEMTATQAAQEMGISRRSWYNLCSRTA